jgi:hypothetical protein
MYASMVWHIASTKSLGLQCALITHRKLMKFSSHNFLLLTWKTKHHLNPPSLSTISPCKCHSSKAHCWLMVKPGVSINSSLMKITHTLEFKYTCSLHSSYLKPQTINMDVIPLDLLCLQKAYDSNLIDLQFVCWSYHFNTFLIF